ncbi:M14 family zinc carboxypeptidase [Neptuniibacter halophilus]|uniref:M14 family zinc carboxypeptidase n=1 Tax=Neptuniibacter halophilus TaxID=651666 RepID=UPI0025724A64|nr:M14 family zinc carboxypeptidase [Neptuniibacter halophilus]
MIPKKLINLLSIGLLGVMPWCVSAAELHPEVRQICQQIGKKLASVSPDECLSHQYVAPRFHSVRGQPILETHFPARKGSEERVPRVLFIGGIHGDEYSSVSVTFKWLNTLKAHHSGAFDWHFVPLLNPDGLLQRKSTRVNANRVDLNRNFLPAPEFPEPLEHWQKRAKKRLRYFPGHAPLSEPESQVIHQLIDEYQPTVIVSVHAPHGILDFDGGIQPPRKLGPLQLRQLGTYPGSLGNYGWFVKNIPVVTIELPHAGIMPETRDIDRMWTDLVRWLNYKARGMSKVAQAGVVN